MFYYNAYGLHFQSCIALPEYLPSNRLRPVDVRISTGKTPQNLQNPLRSNKIFQVGWEEVLINFKNIGRFWIRSGKEIVFKLHQEVNKNTLRLILLGSCMGALLMQRGFHSLHGSSIGTIDKSAVFLGAPGAGKSTLAASLIDEGYYLLSDDLCTVSNNNVNKLPHSTGARNTNYVIPAFPQIKLLKDILVFTGKFQQALHLADAHREKYALQIEKFQTNPVPLKWIFCLDFGEENSIIPLEPYQRVGHLMNHTYRPKLFQGIYNLEEHFRRCVSLCSTVPVFKLTQQRDMTKQHLLISELKSLLAS